MQSAFRRLFMYLSIYTSEGVAVNAWLSCLLNPSLLIRISLFLWAWSHGAKLSHTLVECMESKGNQLANKKRCHSVRVCFLLDEVEVWTYCRSRKSMENMTLIRGLACSPSPTQLPKTPNLGPKQSTYIHICVRKLMYQAEKERDAQTLTTFKSTAQCNIMIWCPRPPRSLIRMCLCSECEYLWLFSLFPRLSLPPLLAVFNYLQFFGGRGGGKRNK